MNIELIKLGMEKHRSQDYVNSIKIFTQAISEDSDNLMNLQLYFGIGEAKFKLGDFSGSIDAYTKGLNIYISKIDLFEEKHPQIIESTKTLIAQAYRIRANGKKELADYKGAILDYTKSIEMNNSLSESIYSRGVVYMETKNYNLAKRDFVRVLEIHPNDAGAYRNLGNAKFQLEDFSGAVYDYSKALILSIPIELRAEVYNNRGSALSALGQYHNAALDFAKALEINPNDHVTIANFHELKPYLSGQQFFMNPTDMTNLKEVITFELGMTLTGMLKSKKYSTEEIIDVGAYIGAHFIHVSDIPVFPNDKEEVVKHIFSFYTDMFTTSITRIHLDRIQIKFYELLRTDHIYIENYLQKIIDTFMD